MNVFPTKVMVKGREISPRAPVYFIADIAANHDGSLQRAVDLIHLAKQAGAHAAKFQHFLADKIVSDRGFRAIGAQLSHQAKWGRPVYDVYKQYECDRSWTETLARTCYAAGVDFLTAPYDFEAVDLIDPFVPAWKIGSGDITWTGFIAHVAAKGKPVFLATGAATLEDTRRAVDAVKQHTSDLVLMQCNTNYTGSADNFKYVNLRVLETFRREFPGVLLGLSDHTPGHAAVLGAIALGACAVEKHFTDDNARTGPDHPFAMNPATWREMVDRANELHAALGDGTKRVEENERDTVIVQRRCVRAARDIPAGATLAAGDLTVLRPAAEGSFAPYELDRIVGKKIKHALVRGDAVQRGDVEE